MVITEQVPQAFCTLCHTVLQCMHRYHYSYYELELDNLNLNWFCNLLLDAQSSEYV